MNRISPQALSGPSAYFTEFDHRIVERSTNHILLKKKSERKLKVLLLLKSHIVCAASHLATRFAYDFFKENPVLLTNEAILPAFRADKSNLSELFARKKFSGREDAVHFYNDHVRTTITWELEENSGWFRDRFIADLEDKQSVLRRHFGDQHQDCISALLNEIRRESLLSRDTIDKATAGLPKQYRRLLKTYRELLYHVSGARVVNCESALPQENYIDYDLADLQQKRVRLTEEQIFWKLLIEIIMDSLQCAVLPIEVLDSLSFSDVMQIRQPLMQSSFQGKYDKLIRSVIGYHSLSDFRVLNINELEKIRAELALTFNEVIEKELPHFLKKKAIRQCKQLASVSSSVALNLLSPLPGISLVSGVVGALKDSPALFFNVGQTYKSLRAINDLRHYYASKEILLGKEIEQHDISEKASLHDMVALVIGAVGQRIAL